MESPKLEYPCLFPIKIVGHAADDFVDYVVSVVLKHAPDLDHSTVSARPSSAGKYTSVTVTILCTGPAQLEALHIDLKVAGRVVMVI